jgi:hypothetical protein
VNPNRIAETVVNGTAKLMNMTSMTVGRGGRGEEQLFLITLQVEVTT